LNLDNLSLLHSQPPPPHAAAWKLPYTSLRKHLRLLLEEVPNEETHLSDISCVYSGYAPLSVRLIQCIAQTNGMLASSSGNLAASGADEGTSGKKTTKVNAHPAVGWKGFEDVVATIPGKIVDIVQQSADGAIPSCMYSPIQADVTTSPFFPTALPKEKSTTTVVFFLGGCTHSEISAIRWLGQHSHGMWVHCYLVGKKITEPVSRTKVCDCHDWYREREFFDRCFDAGEFHESVVTALIN
jgi:vacuolar protein sorting-associated protein 33A